MRGSVLRLEKLPGAVALVHFQRAGEGAVEAGVGVVGTGVEEHGQPLRVHIKRGSILVEGVFMRCVRNHEARVAAVPRAE